MLLPDYRSDRQLRDRLFNAIDIPSIQDSLRDRTPRMSQQWISRIENRLSSQRNTAGTPSADVAEDVYLSSDGGDDVALYKLVQRYGGDPKRNLKTYGLKRSTFNTKKREEEFPPRPT